MFVLQFVNTGIIIFFVNLNLGLSYGDFPIFEGEYEQINV